VKDSTTTPIHDVSNVAPTGMHDELHITDLYSATYATPCYMTSPHVKSVPFTHPIALKNLDDAEVRVQALFDDGAMTGAMCSSVFNIVKHTLKGWQPSTQMLRMANGAVIPSEATWTGTICVEGIEACGTFEVFNSGGGWSFLFGKPLLRAFKAKHDYVTDEVTIADNRNVATLRNHLTENPGHRPHDTQSQTKAENNQNAWPTNAKDHPVNAPCTIGTIASAETAPTKAANIFTRQTDPFAQPRVDYITRSVKIGNDTSPKEREEVTKLLTEFADVFACSLKEVLPIPEAQVELTIPEDAMF